MGKAKLAPLLMAGVFLMGCNTVQPAPNEKSIRRFEPAFSTDGYGIALDTVTGQWCKAWNWRMHPTNESLMGLNDLPLCIDIYKQDALLHKALAGLQ